MDMAAITAEASFGAFAEEVTLNGVTVRGIPEFGVAMVGEFDQVTERRTLLSLLKSECPAVARGQSVTLRGEAYTVDQIEKDDGAVVRVVLR